MTPPPLRLAVHYDHGWTELTTPRHSPDRVTRVRAGSLSEAARLSAIAPSPAFVDVDVLLAGSVNEAFLAFTEQRPGWSPGARAEAIVHPGTAATLAGLLWDIWAARVAPGVTLYATDPAALTERLLTEVVPLLAARGLTLELSDAATSAA
ncbi:hypothetical protein [Gordonia iterans]